MEQETSPEKKSEKKSVATQIVDSVLSAAEGSVELWHTVNDESYISLRYPDGHFEHRLLCSRDTTEWLASLFYDRTRTVATSANLKDAITVLEGNAQKGKEHVSYIRVGKDDSAIFLDLGDDSWKAVKVTAKGWEIVKNPPVKFRRPKGLLSLPIPELCGSLDDHLRPFLNAGNDDDWVLIKAWLLGLLRASGPYSMLVLAGEQGTAKSYTQKVLRNIIDPNELPIRRPARTTDDLMIAANNSLVVSLDNMSGIKPDLSDDLCNVATGGGLSKRTLFTNMGETIIHVCRPIILNGIEDIVTRPDLLDRSIVITLSSIPKEKRQPEDKLLMQIESRHPWILGALLDSAVIAMQKQDDIILNDSYRMAGFVKWAAAGLGVDGEKFLAAYKAKRTNAAKDSLEGDELVIQIKVFAQNLKGKPWVGSANDLLDKLNTQAGHGKNIPPGWPKMPNQLSGQLRRLAPSLRAEGINIEGEKRDPVTNVKQWKVENLSPSNCITV